MALPIPDALDRLMALRIEMLSPIAAIRGNLHVIRKLVDFAQVTGLPDEFELWINEMREAAEKIHDFLEVFSNPTEVAIASEDEVTQRLANLRSQILTPIALVRGNLVVIHKVVDFRQVTGLPDEFELWLQEMQRAADSLQEFLDLYTHSDR